MAFTAVQTATVPGASTASSVAVTLSSTTQYNLVVVHIRIAGITETCTSVTDNQGNTYVLQAVVQSVTERSYQAYGVQLTGGVTTVTANFSSNVINKKVGADEYGGFGSSATNAAVFDVSTTGTGLGNNTSVSTLTPAATGELIVATLQADNNATWTAGSGYTLLTAVSQQPNTIVSQYKLSGASSETAPASYGGGTLQWTERATAFKAPAPASAIKTIDGLAKASAKTVDGLAIASVKSINGLQ